MAEIEVGDIVQLVNEFGKIPNIGEWVGPVTRIEGGNIFYLRRSFGTTHKEGQDRADRFILVRKASDAKPAPGLTLTEAFLKEAVEENKRLKERVAKLEELLVGLADIVDAAVANRSTDDMDSFTTQPARAALEKEVNREGG